MAHSPRLVPLLTRLLLIIALFVIVPAQARAPKRLVGPADPEREYNHVMELIGEAKWADALPSTIALERWSIKGFGPDSESHATMLGIKGRVLTGLFRYDEALVATNEAIRILKLVLPQDHDYTLTELSYAGTTLSAADRLDEAAAMFQEAVDGFDRSGRENDPKIIQVLARLASVRESQNNLPEAERLIDRAMGIANRSPAESQRFMYRALITLGHLKLARSAYEDAVELFQQAIALGDKTDRDGLEEYHAYWDLVSAYIQLQRYDDAELMQHRMAESVLRIASRTSVKFVQSQTALGDIKFARKEFAAAEKIRREIVDVFSKTPGVSQSQLARAYENYGDTLQRLGRLDESDVAWTAALRLTRAIYDDRNPRVASVLWSLAEGLKQRGRYDEADAMYAKALAIDESAGGHDDPTLANLYGSIGDLYYRQDKWEQSLDYHRRARDTTTAYLGRELGITRALDQHGGLFSATFANIVIVASRVAEQRPELTNPLAQEAFEAMQLAQQSAAGAALGNLAARLATENTSLARKIRSYQDLIAQAKVYDQKLVAIVGDRKTQPAVETALREQIATTKAELAKQGRELARDFPQFTELSHPAPLKVPELQQLLAPDEAFISFLFPSTEDEGYVFAATRETFAFKRLSARGLDVTKTIETLRSQLDVFSAKPGTRRQRLFFDTGAAYELYKTLLGPVEPIIAGKPKIIIAPHGALTSFPFALLVTEPPPPKSDDIEAQLEAYAKTAWFIRQHAVSVIPTPQSLRSLRLVIGQSPASKPLIGYGNPIFKRTDDSPAANQPAARGPTVASLHDIYRGSSVDVDKLQRLAPLPETADELREIAQSLDDTAGVLKLGPAATVSDVKTTPLDDYRIVYFATHALVAGDVDGLVEPALVLSAPQTPTATNTGLLTVSDIVQLKLNADWVVLSACNTAAGDKPGADGLSGLARAFFYAGARSLLVSHWPLNSRSAVLLTTKTFAVLKDNRAAGRAEALRQAMLALLDHPPSPLYRHPAYWAPFVLAGDGR